MKKWLISIYSLLCAMVLCAAKPADTAPVMLIVEGDPQAAIYVDDQLKGRGQWSGSLPMGIHPIRVKRANHLTITDELHIESTDPVRKLLSAPVPIIGSLTIDSDPQGARIYVDGQDTRQVTPFTFPRVLIGRHQITLKYDDCDDYVMDVEVVEGVDTKRIASLNPRRRVHFGLPGSLKLSSVAVYENGLLKTTGAHFPSTMAIERGPREMRFEATGYYPLETTVDADQTDVILRFSPLPTQREQDRMEFYHHAGTVRVDWLAANVELGTNVGASVSLFNVRYKWVQVMPLQVGMIGTFYQTTGRAAFPTKMDQWTIVYEPEIRTHLLTPGHIDCFLGVGAMVPIDRFSSSLNWGFGSYVGMLQGGMQRVWFLADLGFQKIGDHGGTFQMFVRYNGGVALCLGMSLGTGFRRPHLPKFMLDTAL